jgi:hypothetical protein
MGLASDFLKRQASQFVDRGINSLLGGIFGGPQEAGSGFSVNRMVASLDKSGIAPSSHFEVFIFGGKNVGDERDMAFRVDTIDLPGRNFAPIDHKFTNMGPVNRIPGQQFYSDVTATILLSEDLREKDYFEWWHEKIVNTGAYETASTYAAEDAANEQARTDAETNMVAFEAIPSKYNRSYSNSPFTHRYFDSYIGRVEIRQYGMNGELRSIHTLNEAYPLSIAPISMSWGSEDAARMQVTFGYRNYKAVFNKADQPGMGFGFSFSLGKGGLKLGARLPGLGNIGFAKGAGLTANLGGLSKKIFG